MEQILAGQADLFFLAWIYCKSLTSVFCGLLPSAHSAKIAVTTGG